LKRGEKRRKPERTCPPVLGTATFTDLSFFHVWREILRKCKVALHGTLKRKRGNGGIYYE
jgi:hypothetical protein